MTNKSQGSHLCDPAGHGQLIDCGPKLHAGNRTVVFRADFVPELADHLERFADLMPGGSRSLGLVYPAS